SAARRRPARRHRADPRSPRRGPRAGPALSLDFWLTPEGMADPSRLSAAFAPVVLAIALLSLRATNANSAGNPLHCANWGDLDTPFTSNVMFFRVTVPAVLSSISVPTSRRVTQRSLERL